MTEQQLHIAVAQYLDLALPKADTALPGGIPWTTIAHGGGGKIRGALLKAMGLKPGWPDIHILFAGAHYIELKKEGGKLSKAQKAVHAAIRGAGGRVAVCRSIQDVEETLRDWGIPLKARAA